jgi:hypothetical protein
MSKSCGPPATPATRPTSRCSESDGPPTAFPPGCCSLCPKAKLGENVALASPIPRDGSASDRTHKGRPRRLFAADGASGQDARGLRRLGAVSVHRPNPRAGSWFPSTPCIPPGAPPLRVPVQRRQRSPVRLSRSGRSCQFGRASAPTRDAAAARRAPSRGRASLGRPVKDRLAMSCL